jgi:hypothetical protein
MVPFLPSYVPPNVIRFRTDYFFFNSAESRSSSEANSPSAGQRIICLLWNAKFHYYVNRNPPMTQTFVKVLKWGTEKVQYSNGFFYKLINGFPA